MQRNKTLLQISIKSKIKFTMQLGRAIIELLVSLFFSEVRKKSKTRKDGDKNDRKRGFGTQTDCRRICAGSIGGDGGEDESGTHTE